MAQCTPSMYASEQSVVILELRSLSLLISEWNCEVSNEKRLCGLRSAAFDVVEDLSALVNSEVGVIEVDVYGGLVLHVVVLVAFGKTGPHELLNESKYILTLGVFKVHSFLDE